MAVSKKPYYGKYKESSPSDKLFVNLRIQQKTSTNQYKLTF
jgi:hypothetical protein